MIRQQRYIHEEKVTYKKMNSWSYIIECLKNTLEQFFLIEILSSMAVTNKI